MEKSYPARDKKVLNMVQRPARRPFGHARGAFCLEKKTAGTPAAIIFARLPGLQQSARLEEVQALKNSIAELEETVGSTRKINRIIVSELREVVKTLEEKENPARYRSQITLAKRRIEAFTIANAQIERELSALDE